MPAPKKPRKSNSPKNQYTAELSSSQLVLGITILMVFGLACFLLGVLIGKFDPSLSPEQQVAQSEAPEIESASPADAGTASDNSDSTPPTEVKHKKEAPVIEEKHIVVASKSTTKPVKPATQVPGSASISVTDLEPNERQRVTIPENTPQKALAKPDIRLPEVQALASPGAVKPPVPSSKDEWSVQIAAFKDETSAAVERKRLEGILPFKVDILERKGYEYDQLLLIGHYATKSEASAFRQELIEKYEMVKPFLVNRN
ncbi:MAG TPA: SPOR domain-containing protein [Candidatus Hydrogenedentes bacterium]|nr:SPOR domain-containing protein [Candidatus Hydrogenedentota bacterium]